MKSDKNSFTLFETIISIFILSLVIIGFSQISFYDNFDKEFMLLNKLENSFTTNSYDNNFNKNINTIEIITNNTNIKSIQINEIVYKDKSIKLKKYELLK